MYKRPVIETVQYCYRSGPVKNCMSSSSVSYFYQSCHVIKASTDINVDKLAEFFVENVEGVRAAAAAIVYSP